MTSESPSDGGPGVTTENPVPSWDAPQPVDLRDPSPPATRRRRRGLVILLTAWVIIMAGEVGYIVGRDRARPREPVPAPAAQPGAFSVLQALVRSQQERLAQAAAATATTVAPTTTAPAPVTVPVGSFDILGGAPSASFGGVLARASCDGFGDANACAAENSIGITIARAADGTLTLSSALFENAALTGDSRTLTAHGPITNATYAISCQGTTVPTLFDVRLQTDGIVVDHGTPAVVRFGATLTIEAPPSGPCSSRTRVGYGGTLTRS